MPARFFETDAQPNGTWFSGLSCSGVRSQGQHVGRNHLFWVGKQNEYERRVKIDSMRDGFMCFVTQEIHNCRVKDFKGDTWSERDIVLRGNQSLPSKHRKRHSSISPRIWMDYAMENMWYWRERDNEKSSYSMPSTKHSSCGRQSCICWKRSRSQAAHNCLDFDFLCARRLKDCGCIYIAVQPCQKHESVDNHFAADN